ncbi:MAG: nitronate monooxygenase [Spirochaetales bacterium]|nr:nitronate monooxygenase [Spirochaetales bacterium]
MDNLIENNLEEMPELNIGGLKARLPIIQGGMGVGISLSGLASAVANEGGIGVIAAVGISATKSEVSKTFRKDNIDSLKEEIRKARALSDGIIGVNIMVALTDFDDLFAATVEEGADIAFVGAGLPLRVPKLLTEEQKKEHKTRIVPIVSSARATNIILRSWEKNNFYPDAVVVEGPKAGGHLGFKEEQITDPEYSLDKILPEIIDTVKPYEERSGWKIPVIAAGGIYTGSDILKYLNMGASGVQMATRFVTTYECDADIKFKEAYINAKEEDINIIKSPVGLPGRAINNGFLIDVKNGKKKPFKCPWKCLITCDFKTTPYCIAQALTNAQKGNLKDGFAFAGANAYRATEIISVREVFNSLAEEYKYTVSAFEYLGNFRKQLIS